MGRPTTVGDAPRISVIVPTRNRRRLLRRLLDAMAEQTLSDYEVIVVDDGSTDGSAEDVEAETRAGRPVRLLRGEGTGAPSWPRRLRTRRRCPAPRLCPRHS